MDPVVIRVPEPVLMQENLHCNGPVDFMQRERYFSRSAQIQAGNWIAQYEFIHLAYACEILRIFLNICNKFLGDSALGWRTILETSEYRTKRTVAFSLTRSLSHIKLFETELCFTFQNFISWTVPSLKLFYKRHIFYMKLKYWNCFWLRTISFIFVHV